MGLETWELRAPAPGREVSLARASNNRYFCAAKAQPTCEECRLCPTIFRYRPSVPVRYLPTPVEAFQTQLPQPTTQAVPAMSVTTSASATRSGLVGVVHVEIGQYTNSYTREAGNNLRPASPSFFPIRADAILAQLLLVLALFL